LVEGLGQEFLVKFILRVNYLLYLPFESIEDIFSCKRNRVTNIYYSYSKERIIRNRIFPLLTHFPYSRRSLFGKIDALFAQQEENE